MKFLQEVTEWRNETPNHIYLVVDSKDKMHGYVKSGSDTLELFKAPLPFDVRRRKFREVSNTYGYVEPALVASADRWEVRSESGNVYTIEKHDDRLSCSCPGFKFRGKCRHVEVQPVAKPVMRAVRIA